MIRTVLVDDSPTFRTLLQSILEAAGDFSVVGVASEGEKAVTLVEQLAPDLVLMDVMLAGMDGLGATREIMERCPTPVVVVSSLVDSKAQKVIFEALSAGAVDVLSKPRDAHDLEVRQKFVATLRAMATLKVVRRRVNRVSTPVKLVAIGASTGGPPAIAQLLGQLNPTFSTPVVIAQHIAHGFTAGLARWLDEVSHLRVHIVSGTVNLAPRSVYLPADGCDLTVTPTHVTAHPAAPSESASPNVDRLFESCAAFGRGPGVVAVLLTGMGADGANGLLSLRRLGHLTIAQNEATSLVYGMPRVARERGAVAEELPLEAIGPYLNQLAAGRST